MVKVLVPIKQVIDPDHSSRIRLDSDGTALDCEGLPTLANPFDEYALEAALRLTEDGRRPKQRLGTVLAMTVGMPATERLLRSALALGADAAVRIDANDDELDASIVSKAIARLARESATDLVLMGKQSVDGDGNEVAQRVAALLDWPQVTCASRIDEAPTGSLLVEREVDGGHLSVSVALPVVISVDLRIITADAVFSRHTPRDYAYPAGVRYASLPAIVGAKRKSIQKRALCEMVDTTTPCLQYSAYELSTARCPCRFVAAADELLNAITGRVSF